MRRTMMGMLLLLAWPVSALAQSPRASGESRVASESRAADEATRVAARQIAAEGMMAFDAGDCETATGKLSRAHEIVHAPTVAYYAGVCLEKLGRLGEALRMYESAVLDPIEGAADVQRKAQEDAAAAKARLLPVLFPPPVMRLGSGLPEAVPPSDGGKPEATAPRASARPLPGPWIVGGVGVVGVVVGIAVGAVVVEKHGVVGQHCSYGPPAVCRDQAGVDAANAVRALGPVATVGLVVGGVGLAAAGVWLGVRSRATAVKVGVAGSSLRVEASW